MENDTPTEKESLSHLEQENQALRELVEQLDRAARRPVDPSLGCLAMIGMGIVSIVLGLIVFWLLYQYPPWIKARSQYHQVLYWSKWQKDKETRFAGFDHIDSAAKKHMEKPTTIASGELFDVTEYRVCWPVLWIEWAIVCGLIGVIFNFGFRRR